MLYEQCLEVVYRLAEQGHSREAMLGLLRVWASRVGTCFLMRHRNPKAVVRPKQAGCQGFGS